MAEKPDTTTQTTTATAESPAAAPFVPAEPDVENATPLAWIVDRAKAEYGRFRATANLTVDGILAFTTGSPVNATHPRLFPGPWGAGWIADGVVEDTQPGEPIPGQPIPAAPTE